MATVEYDPNRSARIALVTYADGEKRYILQPNGMKVGDTIVSGANVDILPGNSMPLKNIPLGTQVHNVELKPGYYSVSPSIAYNQLEPRWMDYVENMLIVHVHDPLPGRMVFGVCLPSTRPVTVHASETPLGADLSRAAGVSGHPRTTISDSTERESP